MYQIDLQVEATYVACIHIPEANSEWWYNSTPSTSIKFGQFMESSKFVLPAGREKIIDDRIAKPNLSSGGFSNRTKSNPTTTG
jgi:hypothetical protein